MPSERGPTYTLLDRLTASRADIRQNDATRPRIQSVVRLPFNGSGSEWDVPHLPVQGVRIQLAPVERFEYLRLGMVGRGPKGSGAGWDTEFQDTGFPECLRNLLHRGVVGGKFKSLGQRSTDHGLEVVSDLSIERLTETG